MVATTNIAIEHAGPDISRLVESATHGRDLIITRGGQPVARIVSIGGTHMRPKAGYGKGTAAGMAADFDSLLPDFDEEP